MQRQQLLQERQSFHIEIYKREEKLARREANLSFNQRQAASGSANHLVSQSQPTQIGLQHQPTTQSQPNLEYVSTITQDISSLSNDQMNIDFTI